jgi:hypothetical protein
MNKRWAVILAAIVALSLGVNCGVSAQEGGPAATLASGKPEGVVSATVITAHGKIIKVNKARKQVTLELSEGAESNG